MPRLFRSPLERPSYAALTLGLACLLGLMGAAKTAAQGSQASSPRSGAADTETTGAAGGGSDAEAASADGETGEDGYVWLTDDEGRIYRVERFKKHKNYYRFVGENRVRTHWGVEVDIVGEDDESFLIKVYQPVGTPLPAVSAPPSEEDLAAVAETYEVSLKREDRLEFSVYGVGLPDQGQWRNGFELADINGDGHLDIVHCPPRKSGGWPIIFLGDGKGTWTPWREVTFPRRYDYGDVAVADFNNDGIMDLAVAVHLRGIQALIHDGKGNFTDFSRGLDYQEPGPTYDPSAFSSRTLMATDFDGDGRQDLIALGEGPTLANPNEQERRAQAAGDGMTFVSWGPVVYLNRGNSWVRVDRGVALNRVFGDSLAVADFNQDGKVDFLTSSNVMTRRDLLNVNETGKFESYEVPAVRPNGYVRSVTTGDFDEDGRPDIALAYLSYELGVWRVGVDVLLARKDGEWDRRTLTAREGRLAIYAVEQGDFDGDGHLDLVSIDQDGGFFVFLGDGTGSFVMEDSPELFQPIGRCRGFLIRTADLNNDGRDELVANFAGEPSAYFDPDYCPSGGGVVAFQATPRAAQADREAP